MLLSNHTSRTYTLPRRERDGVSFGGVGFAVRPDTSIEVPAWYADELGREPGFAARFRSGEMTVSQACAPEAAPADAPPDTRTEVPDAADSEAAPADAPPGKGKGKKRRG